MTCRRCASKAPAQGTQLQLCAECGEFVFVTKMAPAIRSGRTEPAMLALQQMYGWLPSLTTRTIIPAEPPQRPRSKGQSAKTGRVTRLRDAFQSGLSTRTRTT